MFGDCVKCEVFPFQTEKSEWKVINGLPLFVFCLSTVCNDSVEVDVVFEVFSVGVE